MKIRAFVAVAAVAALSACNDAGEGNAAANAATVEENASAPAGATAGAGQNGAAARTVDPQLEQEISMAVQMLRPQLPLKQGPVTVTALESRGGELIYTMEVPEDLDQAKFQQFEQQLPVQACANPQARQMFERGGTYTYILKDPGGEEFRTSVSSC